MNLTEPQKRLFGHKEFLPNWKAAFLTFLLITTMPLDAMSQTYQVERLNSGEPIITAEMFAELGATEREGRSINGATLVKLPEWLESAEPGELFSMFLGSHAVALLVAPTAQLCTCTQTLQSRRARAAPPSRQQNPRAAPPSRRPNRRRQASRRRRSDQQVDIAHFGVHLTCRRLCA